LTVRNPFTESPREAVISAVTVPAVNVVVLAVKVAADCPPGIVTSDGTVTKLFVLDNPICAPPEGAAVLRVAVPIEEFPAVTVLGLNVSSVTADTAGPHWPGTPPPPHVCPGRFVQPQVSVPPQPFDCVPQDGPPEHATGTQPGVTVSACVSGACPDVPSLALIMTVVCSGTDFAA
jgi:hypothetical protein